MCIREGKPSVFNDFANDPRALPWHKAATAHGMRAAAALPICFQGRVWGALTVYAAEAGVFQDKEIALLEEAAADISFALDNIEREAQRRRAEEALRESEDRYRSLVELSPDAIFLNKGGKIVFINQAGLKLFGADRPEQMLGRSPLDFTHPDYHSLVKERIRLQIEEGKTVPPVAMKSLPAGWDAGGCRGVGGARYTAGRNGDTGSSARHHWAEAA